MKNATELSPCPFCGHEHPSFERTGTPRQSCIVVCGNCGCRHESSDEGERSGSSWNTRASPAPGRAPLTETDMEDLKRLREVFDDGQGYDVPKERMKRLAELGVVRWRGRDIYSITAFGMYCLGDWELPLRTAEEINAALHAEMLARNGIAPAGGIRGDPT